MSLSDEERLQGFFNDLAEIRMRLEHILELVSAQYAYTRGWSKRMDTLVKEWIEQCNKVVGMQFTALNKSETYWILGEPVNGYKSLFINYYNMGKGVKKGEVDEKMREFYENEISIKYFLSHFSCPDSMTEKERVALNIQLIVWEIIELFNDILYRVFRYEDDVFSLCVKEALFDFIGSVLNCRYALIGVCDKQQFGKAEQILFCRYLVLQDLVRTKNNRKDTRSNGELVSQVVQMPLFKVEKYLEEKETSISRDKHERNKTLVGTLRGDIPEEKELTDIVRNTTNKAEFDKAAEKLEIYYGVNVSDFKVWHPKVVKKGKARVKNQKPLARSENVSTISPKNL